jgi:cephalosporin hydroxylase
MTKIDPAAQFAHERCERIAAYPADKEFSTLSRQWLEMSMQRKYVYNFDWMGRPIIQYPQDMLAMQELVWEVRPDLIIETGNAIQAGKTIDPAKSSRKVIGIDIDIRQHNRTAIESHPMASRIQLIEGSSVARDTIDKVHAAAEGYKRVLVCLDSMHTHDHVLAELDAYATLTTQGSYCVVFDTFVEDMPPNFFADRPWNVGNNPKTAVRQWLATHPEFETDHAIENKLLVTVAPDGFLRRK